MLFIEWQGKNNLDGAVVDLTVATESFLTGKNKCVINLVDEEDDHNNATGMFGITSNENLRFVHKSLHYLKSRVLSI